MIRLLLTLFTLAGGFAAFEYMADGVSSLAVGKAAGLQLQPSDVAYLATQGVFGVNHFFLTLVAYSVPVTLVAIWWAPFKRYFKSLSTLTLVLLGLGALWPTPSSAYYADSDYAEAFMILPNESAFWIPDVGDNKTSQAQFGSEEYYRANKIAAKRFDVTTHAKLPNSGIFANKYVSPGRLIKVDRSPQSREWVKAAHRGTGKNDQSFPCQDNAGLDVTVGIAIGAYVTEENAPKFLYRFGVNDPQGDPKDPQVVFTSVYYGKSLSQVMDEKVRPRIQSLVCDEMTKRSLVDDNAQAAAIMATIEAKVKAYTESVGITLDFIGWADTFEFSKEVQSAIDRNFIASQDQKSALLLGPHVDTLQKLAQAEATRTVADKWNGAMPSSISLWWLPASVSDAVSSFLKPAAPAK